jgi:hypothetical protein
LNKQGRKRFAFASLRKSQKAGLRYVSAVISIEVFGKIPKTQELFLLEILSEKNYQVSGNFFASDLAVLSLQ